MTKLPLKSTRPKYKYETTKVGETVGQDSVVVVGQVPTVLGVMSQTLTDKVIVRCKTCRLASKSDRLYTARRFMSNHFLWFAKRNQKGHNKFSMFSQVNLSRRFHYRDEDQARNDNYWQKVEGD